MVKQCSVCNKTFSIFKSLVNTNDQLTCEECAQNKIRQDGHDRKLESRRQKEELKEAQHRREREANEQRHRQELEQKEQQKMEERKDKEHQKMEEHKDKEHQHELELSMKRQAETERGCQHDRELQMERIRMNGKVAMAEAEARKAEAKAKEAEAKAKEAEAKAKEAASTAKAAEAKMKYAEVEAKIKIAKTKEIEMEHRSMLWKKYFDPETKTQDKQLIMEEIKGLQMVRSSDQNVNKASVVVKENKVPKSKSDSHPHRPWVTTRF